MNDPTDGYVNIVISKYSSTEINELSPSPPNHKPASARLDRVTDGLYEVVSLVLSDVLAPITDCVLGREMGTVYHTKSNDQKTYNTIMGSH